jgi:SM-20-related protein
MSTHALLSRFGLFVAQNFLSTEESANICSEMRVANNTKATVSTRGVSRLDESIRKTKKVEVSLNTLELVKKRLVEIKPKLEKHFDVILSDVQPPQFLLYKEGNFFKLHKDNNPQPEETDIFVRQISTVIFLNPETKSSEKDTYSGGNLTFYGLTDDPLWQSFGFPVVGETGLLVAFRSETIHEVTPVTKGERFTVVGWFF